MKTKGRAIWQAYSDTGALAIACPHCAAEPDKWCTKPDGRVSRVPCVDRIAATAVIAPVIHLPVAIPDNPNRSTDFSEPRHPIGEER
ncbi:zinc finger domain-containing protein [Mycolicibacterium porcinum]|uniref:DNA-binding phage zinc finger domain-containing protein n=1 Tax=Mycolicibacterium porcinum TaxID=39693 RepID=A0ABV3VA37_9MYCO